MARVVAVTALGASGIRCSDAERGQQSLLQEAFAEGRIDQKELDLRVQRALSAKTRDDLAFILRTRPGALRGDGFARPERSERVELRVWPDPSVLAISGRYSAGNAVSANVAHWIGTKITEALP
ncbi:hypothetical protein GCM10029978_073800 [Actinoallomurus acanthiterrae]